MVVTSTQVPSCAPHSLVVQRHVGKVEVVPVLPDCPTVAGLTVPVAIDPPAAELMHDHSSSVAPRVVTMETQQYVVFASTKHGLATAIVTVPPATTSAEVERTEVAPRVIRRDITLMVIPFSNQDTQRKTPNVRPGYVPAA